MAQRISRGTRSSTNGCRVAVADRNGNPYRRPRPAKQPPRQVGLWDSNKRRRFRFGQTLAEVSNAIPGSTTLARRTV